MAGELAHRYFDAIARRQLLAQGHPASRIDHWLRIGRMFPRYPGVYAWGRPELSAKGDLAAGLLYAGKGAGLTGLSALWWQGLLSDRPDLIHIDAPGYASSRQDLRIRHPREINRRLHEDLPVVDLARALLLASSDLELNAMRNVLARADYDKRIPFSLPSLQAAIRSGPVGSRDLRRAMRPTFPSSPAAPTTSRSTSSCFASPTPSPFPSRTSAWGGSCPTWSGRSAS